jgi:hypothetical protein
MDQNNSHNHERWQLWKDIRNWAHQLIVWQISDNISEAQKLSSLTKIHCKNNVTENLYLQVLEWFEFGKVKWYISAQVAEWKVSV